MQMQRHVLVAGAIPGLWRIGRKSREVLRWLESVNVNTWGKAGEVSRGGLCRLLVSPSLMKAAGFVCRAVHCEP